MTPWDDLESAIGAGGLGPAGLLAASEAVLENWVEARGWTPTGRAIEGFRLLALHRQGAVNEPSFNACRETCREIAYYFNLLNEAAEAPEAPRRLAMMELLANHLLLFVRGKMEVAGLGEFCCSSRPVRTIGDISTATGTKG